VSSNVEKKLNLFSSTSKTIDSIFADMNNLLNTLYSNKQFDKKFTHKEKPKKNEHSISGGYHPNPKSTKEDWCTCDKRDIGKRKNPYFEINRSRGKELATLRYNAEDVADKLIDILVKKHSDYGPNNIAKAPGGALNGLSVRLHDKVERLSNLVGQGKHPSNESIEDTFIDIANYAIIALLVLDKKWK
jgi:hypothetical protein